MKTKKQNSFKKITKITLVIYFMVMLVAFIPVLTLSLVKKDNSFIYGYLLCLGPSIFYAIISILFNTQVVLQPSTNRRVIAIVVSLYTIKYLMIIGIPIIGVLNPSTFNIWTILATTLIAPTFVIISKLIIANYVSKNSNSKQKKSKNSIEF